MRFQIRKWLWRPVEFMLAAAFRTFLMAIVFVACASALMSWMGYEVAGVSQVMEYFRSVARLSDLLS